MSDSVPVKVMLASAAPSPAVNVRPVSVLSVSAPWVEASVTEYCPLGARVASTSAIDRPVMAIELSSAPEAVAGAFEVDRIVDRGDGDRDGVAVAGGGARAGRHHAADEVGDRNATVAEPL